MHPRLLSMVRAVKVASHDGVVACQGRRMAPPSRSRCPMASRAFKRTAAGARVVGMNGLSVAAPLSYRSHISPLLRNASAVSPGLPRNAGRINCRMRRGLIGSAYRGDSADAPVPPGSASVDPGQYSTAAPTRLAPHSSAARLSQAAGAPQVVHARSGSCESKFDRGTATEAHDLLAPLAVRSEHAVIHDEVLARSRDEGRKLRDEVDGLADDVGRAVRPRRLEPQRDSSIRTLTQSVMGNRSARTVFHEVLEWSSPLPRLRSRTQRRSCSSKDGGACPHDGACVRDHVAQLVVEQQHATAALVRTTALRSFFPVAA